MIVLDSDHVSILLATRGPAFEALVARMQQSPDQKFCTTIVTFEEHMRGWLAGVQRARKVEQQVQPYDRLLALVRFFQGWEILRFNEFAVARFQSLRAQRIRIGTFDLKIASITLEHGARLLSANGRDFEQVPGLQVEDWLHT